LQFPSPQEHCPAEQVPQSAGFSQAQQPLAPSACGAASAFPPQPGHLHSPLVQVQSTHLQSTHSQSGDLVPDDDILTRSFPLWPETKVTVYVDNIEWGCGFWEECRRSKVWELNELGVVFFFYCTRLRRSMSLIVIVGFLLGITISIRIWY